MKHLVFFDHTCPLCQRAVCRIQKADAKAAFAFYPLTSEIAREKIPENFLQGDTLVLVEGGGRIWVRSKAIFRIAELLGGKFSWLGTFVHVPGLDLFYRILARNRHLFK